MTLLRTPVIFNVFDEEIRHYPLSICYLDEFLNIILKYDKEFNIEYDAYNLSYEEKIEILEKITAFYIKDMKKFMEVILCVINNTQFEHIFKESYPQFKNVSLNKVNPSVLVLAIMLMWIGFLPNVASQTVDAANDLRSDSIAKTLGDYTEKIYTEGKKAIDSM